MVVQYQVIIRMQETLCNLSKLYLCTSEHTHTHLTHTHIEGNEAMNFGEDRAVSREGLDGRKGRRQMIKF